VDTPAYQGRATIHFHPAKHYYTVSVPSLNRERVYQPGVTSIIKLKDKSGPLMWWAVEQCEAYGLQKVAEITAADDECGEVRFVSREFVQKTLHEMRFHYRDVARRAADIGTAVHDYLHRYLVWKSSSGGEEPKRPKESDSNVETNNAIDAGLQFFGEHDMKPLTIEQPVWSATYGYVGTDDFIGYVDDELCVCDYKTSKNLYPEVWLQTAAYQHAYQEEHPRAEVKARWGINVGKDGVLRAERRGPEWFADDFKAFLGLVEIYRWDRIHGGESKTATEVIGPLPDVGWLEELEA
jgi:hypothetical protein